jgi:hypothetical protein
VLHYDFIGHKNHAQSSEVEGNTTFLNSGAAFAKIKPSGIGEIKAHLAVSGIACRLATAL